MNTIQLNRGNELQKTKADLEAEIKVLECFIATEQTKLSQNNGIEFIEKHPAWSKDMFDFLIQKRKEAIERIDKEFEKL